MGAVGRHLQQMNMDCAPLRVSKTAVRACYSRAVLLAGMGATGAAPVSVMLLTVYLLLISFSVHATCFPITAENVFTRGRLSYRRLLVDPESGVLYVGATGHLYKLWAYNINDTSTDALFVDSPFTVSSSDEKDCKQNGHEDCTNGVRLMFLKDEKQNLFVCSSNAMKPQLRELDAQTLQDRSPPENVIGICSPDPADSTTAVLVEWGNPEDIPSVYSGFRTGFSKDSHVIYRPPLFIKGREMYPSMRTVRTDSKWLSEPQFVSSLTAGGYVYFFFREIAVEHQSCGPVIYSRVARLCKKDVGGKNVLRSVWTSFVKARLNCSISSQYPTYFNQLQSIYQVDRDSETFFYAILTTADITFGGSAVCVFTLRSIDQIFNHGLFLEHNSTGNFWTTTPPESVPAYRPGACIRNSLEISDSDLEFAKNHLIMADAVSAGPPLITLPQELLAHIAVDTAESSNIVFAYSHSSQSIYKLVHWEIGVNSEAKLLAKYLVKASSPAYAMAVLPGEYLYISGEDSVRQYAVSQCSLYSTCKRCAIDPYCAWNSARSECSKRDRVQASALGWIIGKPGDKNPCLDGVPRLSVKVFPGDGVHLACDAPATTWRHGGEILEPSDNVHFTTRGGLVLLNISRISSGEYECFNNGERLAVHQVEVDDAEFTRPTSLAQFQSIYREWCKKFATYKNNASKWQRWYEKNGHCPNDKFFSGLKEVSFIE